MFTTLAGHHHELTGIFADAQQRVADARGETSRDLNTPYTFPGYSKAEWEKRAASLRQQIRVATGLVPMPEPTPLNVSVFGKVEREDYTVEKVHFEPFPGFFTTGNLYRPKGKPGLFPGIVSPHGHWSRGRLEDIERGSIPARCINFAKQGYVVFAYDMLGYNDSGKQIEHRYGGAREGLWGLSAMGLQLLNGIRAIDFLQSLPDVDSERIGCTGASGGGTQTFLLTAVDERIKVSAPVNMISGTMQGGCLCENAPNLRLDVSNIEIGALMAPRPLLIVSATGDWTVSTPTVEYPAIQSIYAHFNAEERVHHVQVDAEHNYNRESREAVYAWFAKWFLDADEPDAFKEVAYQVEPDDALLVFSGNDMPAHALKQDEFLPTWVNRAKKALEDRKPKNPTELERFRDEMGSVLQHALGLQLPENEEITCVEPEGAFPITYRRNYTVEHLVIGREGVGDAIPAILVSPRPPVESGALTLVVHPVGKARFVDDTAELAARNLLTDSRSIPESGILPGLLTLRHKLLIIDVFGTGEHSDYQRQEDTPYFTTYNRTTAALRVQDIVTALRCAANRVDVSEVNLIGLGEAGLWAMLAAGFADVANVVVDAAQFDNNMDVVCLETLPIPNLRQAGDFRTAGTLLAPRRLTIYNTGEVFDATWIADVYRVLGASQQLHVEKGMLSEGEVVARLIGNEIR